MLAFPVHSQNSNVSEPVLEHMPCQAWAIMESNNWSGNGRDQIEVTNWTLQFVRTYFKKAAERANSTAQNADGSDVSDGQIINWLTVYCTKNPGNPVIEAVFFLYSSLSLASDHRQLLMPP